MSYYEDLVRQDITDWVDGKLLGQLGWTWRYEDGKIICQIRPGLSSTPWHHVKHAWWVHCNMWHQVMFDVVFARLGKKWVPSKCQGCWKVVVRPKTLKQLFAVLDIQKAMDVPCKCGIEVRATTASNYGGYFYCSSLPEGLERYEQVRKAVDNHVVLGPDVDVLLKRGCTEYEHACGPSDGWTVTDEQLQVEQVVERYVILDDVEVKQPEKLIHHTHRQWIEFAYQRGDQTYLDYTGGQPLFPKYKTYHHLLPMYRAGNLTGEISGEVDASEKNKGIVVENTASKKPMKAERAVRISGTTAVKLK